MKEKIKNVLLIISFTFIICFSLIEIFNLTTYSNKIFLEDKKENIEKYKIYKDEYSKLEESECKESLGKYIERYEKTSYKGEVSLKDIYDNLAYDDSVPVMYQDIRKNCNITVEEVEEYELVHSILDSITGYEEIFSSHRFPYEISLMDKDMREIIEPTLNYYSYDRIKRSELSFIKNVLTILNEREN